ncbi:hypothetical protein PybrP1_007161 [[Pythium] brassicae (nom. inval.)]|nr:hypothetical protein PybrP1_007161 [[Pythium] brassicae (nom. inval.)]
MRPLFASFAATLAAVAACADAGGAMFTAKSGVRPWVDVHTPASARSATSSRDAQWELVFSDEFDVAGRNFSAGRDYLWTALDLPDGVNAALEYYSPNMSSTVAEPDGRGVFQIEVRKEPSIRYTVYNAYSRPPSFETHKMYYRAAMVQSWNKFCYQGGLLEVSAKLPGAVSAASGNPDLAGPANARVKSLAYYPTWPGIWMLGNLARALFTKSTNRMWPWTFDECDPVYAPNQRISACNGNPGYGLNRNQGRGAPEIDVLEGGGTDVSSSIQLAPGMPDKFRVFPATSDASMFCFYTADCKTPGANFPGIPTALYKARGYSSWYQGLKYAPSMVCAPDASKIQDPAAVKASMKAGVTDNTCAGVNTCPASKDGYASLEPLDNSTTRFWGVNDVGGCMPVMNGYSGAYLCDPDNTNPKCSDPLTGAMSKSNVMDSFNYQMDAISANSGLPLAAYTSYMRYQVEWVMGRHGYVRWMIEGRPIFEIPAEAIENPPQDTPAKSNPKKLMVEEPMYIIFNVALSTSWGSTPPNPGKPCEGDGKDDKANRICAEFPMFLKIDYIRLYQDVSPGSTMAVGCDPATHPTKGWIDGHITEYEDANNKVIEVVGGAPCFVDDDCTVSVIAAASIITGVCRKGKCSCLSSGGWAGPRCTLAVRDTATAKGFGPSVELASIVATLGLVLLGFVVFQIVTARNNRQLLLQLSMTKSSAAASSGKDVEIEDVIAHSASAPMSDDKLV